MGGGRLAALPLFPPERPSTADDMRGLAAAAGGQGHGRLWLALRPHLGLAARAPSRLDAVVCAGGAGGVRAHNRKYEAAHRQKASNRENTARCSCTAASSRRPPTSTIGMCSAFRRTPSRRFLRILGLHPRPAPAGRGTDGGPRGPIARRRTRRLHQRKRVANWLESRIDNTSPQTDGFCDPDTNRNPELGVSTPAAWLPAKPRQMGKPRGRPEQVWASKSGLDRSSSDPPLLATCWTFKCCGTLELARTPAAAGLVLRVLLAFEGETARDLGAAPRRARVQGKTPGVVPDDPTDCRQPPPPRTRDPP